MTVHLSGTIRFKYKLRLSTHMKLERVTLSLTDMNYEPLCNALLQFSLYCTGMKALDLKALRIIDETEHYFNSFRDGGSFLETRV